MAMPRSVSCDDPRPGKPRKSPLRVAAGAPRPSPAGDRGVPVPPARAELTSGQLRAMMISEFCDWLRSRTNREKRPFQKETVTAYATAAREHIGEVIGRVRYGREEVILTHYGAPAAVVISFEEYQRLKKAGDETPEYQLPPEIEAVIEEGRRHPERSRPRPRRASRAQ